MSDGLSKNWMVVQDELDEFMDGLRTLGRDQLRNVQRLLKPSLFPSNREHFVPHVLVAFISTFYRFVGVVASMTRTWTYTTVIAVVVYLLQALGAVIGV